MNTQASTYKWIAIVLAVVIVILAAVFFMQQPRSASDAFGDAVENLEECEARLASWNEANPGGVAANAEAQAELDRLLAQCEQLLEEAQGQL